LPWFVSYAISVIGWFVVMQTVSDMRRIQADGNGVIGLEPAPATMLNKVKIDIRWSKVLSRSTMIGLIPNGIVLIVAIWLRYPILSPLILSLMVAAQV